MATFPIYIAGQGGLSLRFSELTRYSQEDETVPDDAQNTPELDPAQAEMMVQAIQELEKQESEEETK